MRHSVFLILISQALLAQEAPAPAAQAAQVPVVTLDIAPLAAPDLDSPYASPRDAARHRLQATLAELRSSRNTRAAVQGFAEALLIDRTYAAAAFNLGVVAAIAEKPEDALGALEEAARLDPNGLSKAAAPQMERLRLVRSLEATPEGQRKRRYDEALYPVVTKLSALQPADTMAALSEIGRIDPKRWEAPALLAALNGNGRGYDVAAKFLEIAVANATNPSVKQRLERALHATERELRYSAARAAADAAADRGEYEKAGQLYETAWSAIPARASNGMEAASAWLLHDDTARAAMLLVRLRESGNDEYSTPAVAMLKELDPIEPGVRAAASESGQFFRDAGSTQPVRVSDLVPPVDMTAMEMLARPIPKLVQDPEPVVLLAGLSANPADAAQSAVLPALAAPRVAGENPWRELLQLRSASPSAEAGAIERLVETGDVSHGARMRRLLHVTSQPAGARIFIGDEPASLCQSPCDIQAVPGSYAVRASLPCYQEETEHIRITSAKTDLQFLLRPVRGNVIVQISAPAALKVNETSVANPAPVELSLLPGLYRIAADFGSVTRERLINIKPAARLRLELHP